MRKAFIKTLTDLAQKDSDVTLITGDLGFSVFEDFRDKFPKQFLNAGLCEQSMIGMAAGMAMEGKKVFVYSIIPFLTYRAFEQIRNDLCYQRVPVTLIGVGSGLCYGALGGTHHAIEDVAAMTSLPGIKVFSPSSPAETSLLIERAVLSDIPSYIRLNRAGDPEVHSSPEKISEKFKEGCPVHVAGEGSKIAVFSHGSITTEALDVVSQLNLDGIPASLYSCPTLKPMNTEEFLKIINESEAIVTIEELIERNGLASAISRMMIANNISKPAVMVSLPDDFIHVVGSQSFLRSQYGLTKDNIMKTIQANLGELIQS